MSPEIGSELLRRHYAMREELCAAFIEETRSGPWAVCIVREGPYPAAREWVEPLGGRWRRLVARLRLLLSPSLRRHVTDYARRFRVIYAPWRASEMCLVMEPTAGSLMQVRIEPRGRPGGRGARG